MPVNSVREVINLAEYTAAARWETGRLSADGNSMSDNTLIPWQGSDGDSNGFARTDAMPMEDKGIYTALRMHPKWVDGGTIKGWLPPVLLNGIGTLTAKIGFLSGTGGSDGVTFQVWVHFWDAAGTEQWIKVFSRQKTYDGTLADIAVDLSRWSGQQVSIELRVDAGSSSIQDWAAWIDPLIEVVRQPGPVIRDLNTVNSMIMDDRYSDSLKWYLADYSLPVQKDNFSMTCTANGINTYKGVIQFRLEKKIPAFVADYVRDHPAVTCQEIPLESIDADFNLQINGMPTPFRTTVQHDAITDAVTIVLDIPAQEGLIMIYDAISNDQWAAFCSLSINMVFAAHEPLAEVTVTRLNIARRFMKRVITEPDRLLNKGITFDLQAIRHTAVRGIRIPGKKNITDPGTVPNISRTGRAPIRIPGKQYREDAATPPEPAVINHDAFSYKTGWAFVRLIGNVNFPCNQFPDNYCIRDKDQQLRPFACKPPFPAASANLKTYQELTNIPELQQWGVSTCYRHTINNTFLIIPHRYLISLAKTGNVFIPACYLFTTVDANGLNKSNATFKFDIVPDISAYQLLQIRKYIFNKCFTKELKQTPDDVVIDFPQKIHDAGNISFNINQPVHAAITPMGIYEWGIPGNKYFHLELPDVAIGDGTAAVIASRLKSAGGEIIENLFFDIDSDTGANPQSAVYLSLLAVNGNGLAIRQDDTGDQLLLANKTLYDISIRDLAQPDGVTVPFVLDIPANTKVPAPAQITDSTVINYSYTANEAYISQVLYEKRLTTDQQVKDTLVITSNSGLFSAHQIESIDSYISILKQGESDPEKALANAYLKLTDDGGINVVAFTLPVASYQSQWSVFYKTVIHFNDDTVQDNDPQVIEDINAIGKIINLTVSNLNL